MAGLRSRLDVFELELWNLLTFFVSEVGFFTGDGPEGDLFVLLEKDVVSTERPVKDGDNVSVNLQPTARFTCLIDCASERYCIPLFSFQMCETDSEKAELMFRLQCFPRGELERHLFHRLDVFVKLGKQLGLCVPLELCSFTDVKEKKTNTHTDKKMQSWWNIYCLTDG